MFGFLRGRSVPSLERVEVRYLARVETRSTADSRKTFGDPGRPFVIATEPADLRGLTPAETLYRVGWRRAQMEAVAGEEIVVVIFDAIMPIRRRGRAYTPEVGWLHWGTLGEYAMGDERFRKLATSRGIAADELYEALGVAARTPIGGAPRCSPTLAIKVGALRQLLEEYLGVTERFTGAGITLQEDGQIGSRELVVRCEGAALKLTPDNHAVVSRGVLTREGIAAFFEGAVAAASA